jgi:hypothetical protein
MSITKRVFASKSWYWEFFCILLIIGLNPITHFFNLSPNIFMPDSIAYISMGRDLFDKGLLYIDSWGHIDTGLILPPLYPFFIAIGGLFSKPLLNVAEWVSSISAMSASILIYLYLRKLTSKVIGVATILLIQVNFYYFLVGMRPLSEATFLLTLSLVLLLALVIFKRADRKKRGMAFLVGLACALVFFSRQIGITALLFFGVFGSIWSLSFRRKERRVIFENLLFVLFGWLVAITPYTIGIYNQTGHHPFRQEIFERDHRATNIDREVMAEIRAIERLPARNYQMIYAKRRLLRKLLPDGSEMYAYVDREERKSRGILPVLWSSLKNPKDYINRVYKNLMHFRDPLGYLLLFLFLVFCITPFFIKSVNAKRQERLIIPCFILSYLLVLAFFADKLPRYVYVLFPFAIVQIAIELFICSEIFASSLKIKFPKLMFFCVVYMFFLFITPKLFWDLNLYSKLGGLECEYASLRRKLNEEPVFTLHPLFSYLVGGEYRILPNDSLAKVAKYGRKTGVHWLVIALTDIAREQLTLHTNVNWYWNSSLESEYPGLVKFCCRIDDEEVALYELL